MSRWRKELLNAIGDSDEDDIPYSSPMVQNFGTIDSLIQSVSQFHGKPNIIQGSSILSQFPTAPYSAVKTVSTSRAMRLINNALDDEEDFQEDIATEKIIIEPTKLELNVKDDNKYTPRVKPDVRSIYSCSPSDNFIPYLPDIPFNQPQEPMMLNTDEHSCYVNKYAARYLMNHQIEGIRWLWDKYQKQQGAILGDEMGLGKTIQIAGVLLALYKKSGVISIDKQMIQKRKRSDNTVVKENPSLIVCPTSVCENWYNELKAWGKFEMMILRDLNSSFENVEDIISSSYEVFIVTYSMLGKFLHLLSLVSWNILVFDEGHRLNNPKTSAYDLILKLKVAKSRFILTGTPVQNNLKELWALLNIVTFQSFCNEKDFKLKYIEPIQKSISKNSSEAVRKLGIKMRHELQKEVEKYYLGRTKSVLQGTSNELKGKEEIVVICDLAPLQKKLYEYVLTLPEYEMLRYLGNDRDKCPCANRNKCIHSSDIPLDFSDPTGNTIDKRAALWRSYHSNDEECPRCTARSCISFPCIMKLMSIASHPYLLQVDSKYDHKHPNSLEEYRRMEFMKHGIPSDIIEELGGYHQSTLFSVRSDDSHSGKMIILRQLLEAFDHNRNKTLVFSHSVKSLDFIEDLIKVKAFQYFRIDGETPRDKRQEMINRYNDPSNSRINIFLLSSRAGGVGINLTAATKVILYDVDWNPSVDKQSQDRAYRIGQHEKVTVFRLVAKGTIEELVYMRQLYKIQLGNAALQKGSIDGIIKKNQYHESKRLDLDEIKEDNIDSCGNETEEKVINDDDRHYNFIGIQGDKKQKGELFGLKNLFQFSSDSILESLRLKYSKKIESDLSISSKRPNPIADVEGISKKSINKRRVEVDDFINALKATDIRQLVAKESENNLLDVDFDELLLPSQQKKIKKEVYTPKKNEELVDKRKDNLDVCIRNESNKEESILPDETESLKSSGRKRLLPTSMKSIVKSSQMSNNGIQIRRPVYQEK